MHFKSFWLFIVAFFISSCSSTAHQLAAPTQSTIDKGLDATVALVTVSLSRDVTYPYCTAVWIDKTTILTALHCAQGAATLEEIRKLSPETREVGSAFITKVEDPTGFTTTYIISSEVTGMEGKPKNTHRATVVAIDPDHDLAILKAERPNMPLHTWLPVANRISKQGDKVYVIGHQKGLYFTVMDGMVAAVRPDFPMDDSFHFEGPFLQIYSSIYSGNSGGPVISEKGELIGIVSFTARAPNQGFAIASPSIKKFIFKTYAKNIL